jgi:hypothetical protein
MRYSYEYKRKCIEIYRMVYIQKLQMEYLKVRFEVKSDYEDV